MPKNLCLGLCFPFWADLVVAEVQVVSNGQPAAVIVRTEKAPPVVRYAAEELVYHLQKATGAKLPVATEQSAKLPGPLLSSD